MGFTLLACFFCLSRGHGSFSHIESFSLLVGSFYINYLGIVWIYLPRRNTYLKKKSYQFSILFSNVSSWWKNREFSFLGKHIDPFLQLMLFLLFFGRTMCIDFACKQYQKTSWHLLGIGITYSQCSHWNNLSIKYLKQLKFNVCQCFPNWRRCSLKFLYAKTLISLVLLTWNSF